MRKAILLPAVFLAIATPIAVFVVSGRGTHMSPLLLYPFALPWVILFDAVVPSGEIAALLIACAINAGLLAYAGSVLDRRRPKSPGASR